ncbi:MAG TPA: hypothetical protein VFH27_05695 [Longimicrobiaceae bacterium]|nr:hypothetical protein [Longimicrobiaceae bacterium]
MSDHHASTGLGAGPIDGSTEAGADPSTNVAPPARPPRDLRAPARLAGSSAQSVPLSAFLVRRLAEAADGTRGDQVFCTARLTPDAKFDYEVKTHTTLIEAETEQNNAATRNVTLDIFGPFETQASKGPEIGTSAIKSIVVTLDNDHQVNVSPTTYDSLFWTVSAVDKFVIPYYAREGLGRAGVVRSLFDKEGMVCLEHGPNTEPSVVPASDATLASPIPALGGEKKAGLTFVTVR